MKENEKMSFTFLKHLPTPQEIKEQYPLSEEIIQLKAKRDREISDVLTGKDDRFLVIIGPCSADNEEAVCDYVNRLAPIQEEVKDRLIIIPRIYTNKPRTTGEGYKGIASQPDPEKAPDMVEGLIAVRKMHIRAITESGLTAADEMLYPENWGYVEDLLSYVAIGARSVEDQQHRLTVSGFDVASGMKNPTSGDFSVMLNSVYAAQHPHHFVYRGYEVETSGNPYAHVVLRGAVSKHGNTTTNYHYEDLIRLHEMYEKMDLKNPAAVIDTNHSNSGKQFKEQIRIAKEVMHNRELSQEIHTLVKGLMIESYIEEGAQKIGEHVYGKSITDPCLGWEDSKRLIYDIADMCI
ncbi:MAG: 3-deoxy-7-phosphoheptulonate synthase [Lachnospiraceae bacterium]